MNIYLILSILLFKAIIITEGDKGVYSGSGVGETAVLWTHPLFVGTKVKHWCLTDAKQNNKKP